MPLHIIGHAIVSVDGKIAAADGTMPQNLRNAVDWQRFQAQLDAADLVVLGRKGHERNPNPGRQRLVATRQVDDLTKDPQDANATLWNPNGLSFDSALIALGHATGTIAVAGVFDLFCDHYTAFDLAENQRLLICDGLPCFSQGHPRHVLSACGLSPVGWEILDARADVTLTQWAQRQDQAAFPIG